MAETGLEARFTWFQSLVFKLDYKQQQSTVLNKPYMKLVSGYGARSMILINEC